jgi:hypothetical protein
MNRRDAEERLAEVAAAQADAEPLEVWFLDDARVGQTGQVCRR